MTRSKPAAQLLCKTLFGALFAALLLYPEAHGKSAVPPAAPTFIDTTHEAISSRILRLSNRIDSFFGDKRIEEESNDTRIRLFTRTSLEEASDLETENNYVIQLRLPRTEKRLQFVVRSDEDEDEPEAVNAPTERGSRGAREGLADKTTAALRFLLDVSDIKFSSDMGVRVGLPPQVFARARFRRNFQFGKWIFRPIEKLLWVDREGWYSQTDMNFDRRLNDSWLFRFANKLEWDDQDHILHFRSGPSWFQKVNDQIGLSYNMLSYWEDTPEWAVNNFALSVGFRQLLYKEWFFWEIAPVVNFPREENFHRTPGISVKFEAIFGHI